MASPGSTDSGSSYMQQNSSSEEEIQVQIMDEKKRKRMLSNRESARRSRMRKQKHLDDLMAQVSHLRTTNNQLLNEINISTQSYVKIEAENSVLRAQMSELSSRLQSLNEISNVLSVGGNNNHDYLGVYGYNGDDQGEDLFQVIQESFGSEISLMSPWNYGTCYNYPIMASANMLRY